MNPLDRLNRHIHLLKVLVLAASAVPALQLAYRYASDQLGINGLETLLGVSGYTALVLYILTLAITPARRILAFAMRLARRPYGKRLGDWNWMVRLRRLLGVASFLYAGAHFAMFFYFELDFDWHLLWLEAVERPFILVGMAALVLLLPLFLTSTDYAMRALKKQWRRLHRLMYPIGILIAAHYLWLTKPGVYDAYPYVAIIVLLLLFRLLAAKKWLFIRDDDGMLAER